MKRQQVYQLIFAAHNGPGLWPCTFCHEPVDMFEFRWTVHHLDHDHDNDDPANLAAAHGRCHTGHHAAERYAAGTSGIGPPTTEVANKAWRTRRERYGPTGIGKVQHGAR